MAIKFLSTVAVDTSVLYVDAAANKVGIGTTSPSQKLHVDGNARVTGAYYDSGNTPGTANQVLASTATGTSWIDPGTIVAEAATLVVIACKNTSGATIPKGTPVYQTGNVGATATIEIAPADALISANKLPAIGVLQTDLNNNGFGNVVITGELTNFTTSPIDGVVPTTGDKVFVKSGGGLTLTKPTGEGNGIQNMGLVGKVSGGNAGSITVSSIMRTNDVPNLPEGRIWVGDGNTIVSDTVYIDEPNNRLGIGTNSPLAKTHIKASNAGGDSAASGTLIVEQGSAPSIQLLSANSQTQTIKFADPQSSQIGRISYSHPSDAMFFVTNGTERMRISSTGNVGIGTTSPSYKLDVSGTGRFEDTLSVNGKTVILNNGTLTWGASSDYGQLSWDTGYALYRGQSGKGIKLQVNSSSTVMTLTTGGNVGIGTTSPTNYKLEVDGTVEGSAFSVDGASSRIFAPAGATYNGNGTQTGYLIAKLPDNGASGVNNMMTGVIRVFDYTFHESFDIHFAGYWYSGYNWTNCTAWIDSSSRDDRNFTVRFGAMTGAAGAGTRPYITIGEGSSTWSYCKFSVINYEPGHSNYQAYKWDSGWSMDISVTNPGVVASAISNCQVNNWARNGQDLYYGSGSGNVGIGTTAPSSKLHIDSTGEALRFTRAGQEEYRIIHGTSGLYFTMPNSSALALGITQNSDVDIFNTSGGVMFRADSSTGNVGIGTTSPGYKLHNTGTSRLEGRVTLGGNVNNFIQGNGSSLEFKSNGDYFFNKGASTQLTILSNGNVGIGTTSPSTELSVNGAISAITSDYVQGTTGSRLLMHSAGTGNSHSYIQAQSSGGASNAEDLALQLYGGNVGIGTSSPSTTLDVAGSITTSGALIGPSLFEIIAQYSNRGRITLNSSNNTGANQIALLTNGVARMVVNKEGNVGIGTTSPTQLLDVTGADAEIVINDSNDAPALRFRSSGVTSAMVEVNSAKDMFFKTGGVAEQMRITSAGNVGIGTTSPSSKLNVSGGDINISTSLPSVGSLYNKLNFWGTTAGQGVGASIGAYRGNNYVSGGLIFETGELTTSERMRITPTGNVGIGTTSPGAKLHIEASDPRIKIVDADGTNWESEVFTQGGALKLQARNGTNFGNISFQGDNGIAQSEYARFNSVGNFGIGTTSPGEKLEVSGNIKLSSIGTGNSASSYGMLFYGTTSSGTQTDQAKIHSSPWATNSNGGNLQLYTSNASNALTERMRIDGAGNVGIGTTSPKAKLDVAGGVKVANDTDTATADKEGTLRYRLAPDVPKSQSMVDMCMKTGPSSYAWVNIVTNTWTN